MSKAAATRLHILQQAFGLVYRNGYQATSVDDIIAAAQLTKGAFFYHFKTKDDMGLAMINEVMYPGMHGAMVVGLQRSADPAKDIYAMMRHLLLKEPLFDVRFGCPAVNLTEEMSPLNEQFRKALSRLINEWRDAMQASIESGQQMGRIRKEVDARQVACFIAAGYNGIRNMGKALGASCYTTYLQELKNYLSTLS